MTIKIRSARPCTIYRALLLALLLIGLPLSASADTLTVTVNNIRKAGEIHALSMTMPRRLKLIGARKVAPHPASPKAPLRG